MKVCRWRWFRFIFFAICAAFLCSSVNAASNVLKQEKLTAAVIYQISRFVSWPESESALAHQDDELLICVLGKDRSKLLPQLQYFTSRKSKGRSIKVQSLKNRRDLLAQQSVSGGCHILFSMNGEWDELSDDDIRLLRQKTLLIGKTRDFLKGGGMLALIWVKSKINIVINPDALEGSDVKLESRLRVLAKTL